MSGSRTPKNLTAFAAEKVRGNPPSARLPSAVTNSFPGLEFDIKNLFIDIFVGLKVDAFFPIVVSIQDLGLSQRVNPAMFITQLNGVDVQVAGWNHTLVEHYRLDANDPSQGAEVTLRFENDETFDTRFNKLVVDGIPHLAETGQLTQSLCSPWQHDFKECGCFYWAASRPDMVTNEEGLTGQNWLRRFDHQDTADSYKNEVPGAGPPGPEVDYQTIYHEWERLGMVRKSVNAGQLQPVEKGRVKEDT